MASVAAISRAHPARPMSIHYRPSLVWFIVAKAVVMSATATFLDAPFVKSLVLVAVSAFMTGAFALLIAYMQTRADRDVHERIDRIENRQITVAEQMGIDPEKYTNQQRTDASDGD